MPRQRWRNGGGWTRELLAMPSAQDWHIRVSVADIESDGPFSAYPGVQRWFAVLAGTGVELTIDGTMHRMTPSSNAPLCFDGTAATRCRLLDGATRDLNLMLRGASGGIARCASGLSRQPRESGCGLFAATAGRCLTGGERLEVPADTLLWFDRAPATLTFEASTPDSLAGWWIEATVQRSPA